MDDLGHDFILFQMCDGFSTLCFLSNKTAVSLDDKRQAFKRQVSQDVDHGMTQEKFKGHVTQTWYD